MKAVCLLSGGLDSCVSASVARRRGLELAVLHCSYGQRTQEREEQAFTDIADFYGVATRLIVDLSYLRRIGGSALTDRSVRVPAGDLARPGIPPTYVPFRNAGLLAVAVSWAEVLKASSVYIGAVEEDSSGYPDCRQSFFSAYNLAIQEGTRPDTRIEVVTPLIHKDKKSIVELGVKLGAPLHLTWSCYVSAEKPCGSCDSCLLRHRGFRQAGVPDPLLEPGLRTPAGAPKEWDP